MANLFSHPGKEVLSTERKIYWLASYPKSGNTWIRMFLNAYVTRFPIKLNSAYQCVISDLKPEIYQMMMPRPITELDLSEQFMYHQGALLNLIKLTNTIDICVKTHNAKVIVDGVHLIPPKISGSAIYIIRDPRDIVISQSYHFDITLDKAVSQLADESRAVQSIFNLHHMLMSWSKHVISWTVENTNVPVTVFKYEDMLLHTINCFKEILNALTIPFEEDRFEFALKESSFSNLQKMENEQGFSETGKRGKFFRVGKKGQWKKTLSKKQITQIESDHHEMMVKYGYL